MSQQIAHLTKARMPILHLDGVNQRCLVVEQRLRSHRTVHQDEEVGEQLQPSHITDCEAGGLQKSLGQEVYPAHAEMLSCLRSWFTPDVDEDVDEAGLLVEAVEVVKGHAAHLQVAGDGALEDVPGSAKHRVHHGCEQHASILIRWQPPHCHHPLIPNLDGQVRCEVVALSSLP